MNQSKKLLSALVAIPATVVVAGEVQAAENTLSFEIQNDFVSGKDVDATEVEKLNTTLSSEITSKMKGFNSTFSTTLTNISAEEAKKEVEKVFQNLKANLSDGDNTILYGLFKNATVKATETGEGDKRQVTLDIKINYYGTNDEYKAALDKLPSGVDKTDELKTIKLIHDQIVSSSYINEKENSPTYLALKNAGSSHAYAMYTYMLLKKVDPSFEVRYVYGMKNGEYRSWNIVKIGNEWYNLDVSADDNTTLSNKDVSYRYFLTNNLGEHRITVGAEGINIDTEFKTYDHLATVDNKAVSSDAMYFADKEGKIKKINKSTLLIDTGFFIENATTDTGKLIYVKNGENESLYFINTSMGHYLYEYIINPNSSGTTNPRLLLKEPIDSISAVGTDAIKYKTATEEKTVYVKALLDTHSNAIKAVKDALSEVKTLADEIMLISEEYQDPRTILTTETTLLESKKTELEKIKKELDDADNVEDKKKEEAKLIEEITNLTKKISKLTQDISNLEKKIIKVRELYTSLTREQQTEVKKEYDDSKLDTIEKIIFPENGSNGSVNILINKLNALNILDPDYYDAIKTAEQVFKSLTTTEQNAVYNKSILTTALKEVEKVNTINATFNKLVGETKDPFNVVPNFITEVEKLALSYEKLLPTLQTQITHAAYIKEAKEKRENVEALKLKLSNTDETTADYLNIMKSILEDYNKLTESEKNLFTDKEVAKINLATDSESVLSEFEEKLKEDLKTISDAENQKITIELYNTIQSLYATYSILSTTQLAQLSPVDVLKLTTLMTRLESIKKDTKFKAIESNITKFEEKTINKLTDFKTMVSTVDTDIDALGDNKIVSEVIVQLFSSPSINSIYNTYKAAAGKITELEALIKKVPTSADSKQFENTIKLRKELTSSDYMLLQSVKEVTEAITNIDKLTALIVTNEISSLTGTSPYSEVEKVQKMYEALSKEAKIYLKEKDVNQLQSFWNKASSDAAKLKADIATVQAMIDNLDEVKTTLEDIEKLKEAYKNLQEEGKKLVVGYSDEKFNKILKAIEEREANVTIEEKALALIDQINDLSEESSPDDVEEAWTTYDNEIKVNLNRISEATATRLEKMMKVLKTLREYFKEQQGTAEKEAQPVIDRINIIDLNKYTEAQIKSTHNAYNALSLLAQKVVRDSGALDKLISAENNIINQNTVVKQAKQDAAAFDTYMENITRYSSTSEIAAARALYKSLSYEAKKNVETYNKLVRLETMWKDPEYLELVYTYYPDYINAVKPGGIEIKKPEYDSLYIPDDSESNSVANYMPGEATWSSYEEMPYQYGRYMTKITSAQVKNLSDRTLTLKAGDMEVVLPVADLKDTAGTVGVTLSVSNNQLSIQLTDGNNTKTFSEYVEVHIPMNKLNGTKDKFIERIGSGADSPASFKVEDSNYIIRTKTSGIFSVANNKITYNDLGTSSAGKAIAELAKRGITYNTTTARLVNISKSVTRADVATLIAKALDLSSTSKTKYQDLGTALTSSRAQGLLEAGIMSGATSTRFGGNSNVTKQEAAIIIANMYRYLNQDLSMAYNELNTNFTDVSGLSFEARQSIAILELFGVVDGNGKYNPNDTLTRGEFAELLYKSLKAIDYL